jgi:hypothetical protein
MALNFLTFSPKQECSRFCEHTVIRASFFNKQIPIDVFILIRTKGILWCLPNLVNFSIFKNLGKLNEFEERD